MGKKTGKEREKRATSRMTCMRRDAGKADGAHKTAMRRERGGGFFSFLFLVARTHTFCRSSLKSKRSKVSFLFFFFFWFGKSVGETCSFLLQAPRASAKSILTAHHPTTLEELANATGYSNGNWLTLKKDAQIKSRKR